LHGRFRTDGLFVGCLLIQLVTLLTGIANWDDANARLMPVNVQASV
jgi:hypothetical protein